MSNTTPAPPPPQAVTDAYRRRRLAVQRRMLSLEMAKGAARTFGTAAAGAIIWWIRQH